ncbi:phosphopantothenoylcysteine decarboxylase / phosphopantothenate--cysteine ligase [bacterium A37T11]|nr:phosphopantothenoylcysteine decarboxylase / phosphopantothenate--cysteine ligase [bacterium A37T11]
MLQGKKILLGVCGSIAAYKTAYLTRLLVKAGAQVQVVMTPDATQFITPLTLATLSGRPVLIEYFKTGNGEWNNHVQWGLWSDALLIAPASANTLAKLANGICDNLLCAVYLSARCPVFLAPAMDMDMWAHGSTKLNLSKLQAFGNQMIPPGNGELASGLHGDGRLAEPEDILAHLAAFFELNAPLKGRKALVTAGPTYESIDPVRFIGNHSSGKMGFAIAQQLATLGAEVNLISGPVTLATPNGVQRTDVTSAAEMFEACEAVFENTDIVVMSAAVADYRLAKIATEKIKKQEPSLDLHLEKTTDILATLGSRKKANQLLVGFALETNDEILNAIAKLHKKNLDLIVLNSMRDQGAGFAGDTNQVTLIGKDGEPQSYPLKSKTEVAKDICQKILTLLK